MLCISKMRFLAPRFFINTEIITVYPWKEGVRKFFTHQMPD
jgi:hypothetical protein